MGGYTPVVEVCLEEETITHTGISPLSRLQIVID
jgi:hypothetical protein